MSNETFDGLIWTNPAGVLAQAVVLASRSDRSSRRQVTGEGRSRRNRADAVGVNLPKPLAAAGLMFAGFALGTALVATIIS